MALKPLTRNDQFLSPNTPELAWYSRPKKEKTTVHWGQRKLFLAELAFFNLFLDFKAVPQPQVVYAGAAPGNHIPLLASLFPAMTWHLYDPAPFQIKATPQINLHPENFTEVVAKQWAGRTDVFFI